MIPIYENIDVNLNTSLRVATYRHTKQCESEGWHIHPEYELVYVKNGTGTLRIGTKEIPYKDGALVFLGPNIPHSDFGNKDKSDNMEVVIQFDKDFVDDKIVVFPEFKLLRELIKKSSQVLLFNPGFKKSISTNFEGIEGASSASKLIGVIRILEKMAQSESYSPLFDSYLSSSYKSSDVDRLESVFEFVNANYREPISTQTIADKVGLTTNSFCRFFKKMTSKSFIHFVNEFRIEKAIELFNEAPYSISEVMYKSGYSDASYFSRQFKKKLGITPSAYLQSLFQN